MPFVTNEIMSRIEDPKAKGALARLELGDSPPVSIGPPAKAPQQCPAIPWGFRAGVNGAPKSPADEGPYGAGSNPA